MTKLKITVHQNKFHGEQIFYEGTSEQQAIKAARRYNCTECQCGGPQIIREDGACLFGWEATPPYHPANTPWWENY